MQDKYCTKLEKININKLVLGFLQMSEIISDECSQPLRWSELTPFKFSFKMFIKYVGPGFLVCIAYIDPGNRKIIYFNYFNNNNNSGW